MQQAMRVLLILTAWVNVVPCVARAQDFPSRPIRILTSGAGGNSDFTARIVGQGIAGPLGQPVIVDNRPSGFIPGQFVSKAAPDGYTLLSARTIFWVGPLMEKAPYDVARDFTAIGMTSRSPNVLVIHPSLPVKTVKDLVALAKAKPGQLNYSSTGVGGSSHLAAELFKSLAHVDIVRITYKSSAQGLIDLLGGQVQVSFPGGSAAMPHLKSGRLRALAVTSASPSALFPNLPTVAESVPGYELESVDGIFGPPKMPEAIVMRLNQEIDRFLSTPGAQQQFLSVGAEAAPSSPEQFATAIKAEIARLGKLLTEAGIKAD